MNNVKSNIINSEEFRELIYKKLEPTGWNTALRMHIKSNQFITLLDNLKNEVDLNNRFTPTFKNVFNAFETSSYDSTSVILLGSEPYLRIHEADGLAYSCSRLVRPKTSLVNIQKAIGESVPNSLCKTNSLRYLGDEGVLLLNTSLTGQISKPNKHEQYWKPFIAHLLDHLSSNKPNMVYLLLGEQAHFWEDLIDNTDNIVKAPDPSITPWEHNDCFNKVNEILVSQELPEIKW